MYRYFIPEIIWNRRCKLRLFVRKKIPKTLFINFKTLCNLWHFEKIIKTSWADSHLCIAISSATVSLLNHDHDRWPSSTDLYWEVTRVFKIWEQFTQVFPAIACSVDGIMHCKYVCVFRVVYACGTNVRKLVNYNLSREINTHLFATAKVLICPSAGCKLKCYHNRLSRIISTAFEKYVLTILFYNVFWRVW